VRDRTRTRFGGPGTWLEENLEPKATRVRASRGAGCNLAPLLLAFALRFHGISRHFGLGTATLLTEARVIGRLITHKPIFVGFNVTNRCNLRCSFCSVPELPYPDMTLAQIHHVFDRLVELGIPVVGITGGEPFLRKDLADILAAAEARGMKTTLVTNGAALTRDRMAELSHLRNLVQFALSVDSLDGATYAQLRGRAALPETLARFLSLRRFGPDTSYKINVVVTPENADEVEAMVDFAAATGLFITFIPLNIGPGGLHRGKSHGVITDQDRQRMVSAFETLRRLKLSGAPLWDHRDFYLFAMAYVKGEAMGPCGAGELFLDLRSDGNLAFCNELEHAISLLEVDHISLPTLSAIRRQWAHRIHACATAGACCYTCSYNVVATAQNLPAYIFDYLKLHWRG
jgi:MoaA/NifB/PqqE/SkfB family radical SAM enzyme